MVLISLKSEFRKVLIRLYIESGAAAPATDTAVLSGLSDCVTVPDPVPLDPVCVNTGAVMPATVASRE